MALESMLKPRRALNKALLKVKPKRADMEAFKQALIRMLDHAASAEGETEEFHKNLVADFLKEARYKDRHYLNTKGRNDLVIHTGPKPDSPVGVIVEAKSPSNRTEMPTPDRLQSKALQELVLYYLRERITLRNLEVKHLVVTNAREWFLFDAVTFDRLFAQNKSLVKRFEEFEAGRLADTKTDFFYKQIAEPVLAEVEAELAFTYLDLNDYRKPLRNADPADDTALVTLFKILSPEHLLKLPVANDGNSLNRHFYSELLHIIGLTEVKEKGKKLIRRAEPGQRHSGSLLEATILQLDSLEKLHRLPNADQYGEGKEERLFHVALELTITWVNRILFLKLLEAQLLTYHKGDRSQAFLNIDRVTDYDDLNRLFFQVLAKRPDERHEDVREAFRQVPYLNSSLFEPTELEHHALFISNLSDDKTLPLLSGTVLKLPDGRKRTGHMGALAYLFAFLDAYDFSSEGGDEIQEEGKSLINASVLGLIFEKINGYKDGSFFTPSFITMHMCRESIRRAVVRAFNEAKGWSCTTLDEVYDRIDLEDRAEANRIVNRITICDPAVGSGHFLVSALNELIAIKSDLRILQDRNGKRLKEYQVEIVNDELVVTDEDGALFEYRPGHVESQRVQEALFHEKKTLIEQGLFGVDINPNSVKICRLRLWIELLKNAYYNAEGVLETLPNLDINIKQGNSLVSRFPLDADLRRALKESKWSIGSYREAVRGYRHASNKDEKRGFEQFIEEIKTGFRTEIHRNDKLRVALLRLETEYNRLTLPDMFHEPEERYGNQERSKAAEKRQADLEKEIRAVKEAIREIEQNKIYQNAFEWRFEFPEVLNDDGDFVGFDVVIGNPPYVSLTKLSADFTEYAASRYATYTAGSDLYCLFIELGGSIVKQEGMLTYITSNSWMRSIYGDALKRHVMASFQPVGLLNFEDVQVFEEATVESNILVLRKSDYSEPFDVATLDHSYEFGKPLTKYFDALKYQVKPTTAAEWSFRNAASDALMRKIEQGSVRLGSLNMTINFGIKTGYNEAFIIDGGKRQELISADPNSEAIIKPIIRGRDCSKYVHEFNGKWVITTFPNLQLDIEAFPAIRDHFNRIGRTRLEQTGNPGSRKKTTNKWFETQDTIAYWPEFTKPKIIWGEISDKPKFSYDEKGYYPEATAFFMTGERLKFLLAILNSRLSEWYFALIGTTTGMGTNRWKKYKIELLPIRLPSEEQESGIVSAVDRLLAIKSVNTTADTSALEAEIDQLVYGLYGLTEEEVGVVEG